MVREGGGGFGTVCRVALSYSECEAEQCAESAAQRDFRGAGTVSVHDVSVSVSIQWKIVVKAELGTTKTATNSISILTALTTAHTRHTPNRKTAHLGSESVVVQPRPDVPDAHKARRRARAAGVDDFARIYNRV